MDNKSYLQVRSCENSTEDKVDDYSNDKYTAAIELSNKCREFYKSRLEAANSMKSRWRERSSQLSNSSDSNQTLTSPRSTSTFNDNDRNSTGNKQKNTIDQAMEKLRTEMASLMDQDLSLMKQLLTLNETIEDLKWQRQYYSCSTSCASLSTSRNLDSNWSVSDTEMYDSEDDFRAQTISCSSAHTGHVTGPTWHSTRKARKASKDFETISVDSVSIHVEYADDVKANDRFRAYPCESSSSPNMKSKNLLTVGNTDNVLSHDQILGMTGPLIHHDREQNSFDSGIHEAAPGQDVLVWNV